LHSHSYTGNALACAAANATLDIFESENVIENNQRTIGFIAQELKRFELLARVKEVRQCGMIGVIELEGFDPRERIGLKIHQHCMKMGVLIRPLGSVIYVMAPYIITPEELHKVFKAIEGAIHSIDV
jgi:adenosylmethionine---8-amino-7-oxononanoate aminotransferase